MQLRHSSFQCLCLSTTDCRASFETQMCRQQTAAVKVLCTTRLGFCFGPQDPHFMRHFLGKKASLIVLSPLHCISFLVFSTHQQQLLGACIRGMQQQSGLSDVFTLRRPASRTDDRRGDR